jgi:hypothetical protein
LICNQGILVCIKGTAGVSKAVIAIVPERVVLEEAEMAEEFLEGAHREAADLRVGEASIVGHGRRWKAQRGILSLAGSRRGERTEQTQL